jgi:hypothetical protein
MPNLNKILLNHIFMSFVRDFELQQHPFFTFVFNIGALRISVNNSCKKCFSSEHTFIPSQVTSLFQFT